jgi:Uma2 family endonuclease
MATRSKGGVVVENMAQLLEQLGDVPLERIRTRPAPGTATEQDVRAEGKGAEGRICELVDGVLVEKAMGSRESLLAQEIGRLLGNFVRERGLGVVLGEAGLLRIMPGLVRAPDVSFIPWERIPGDEFTEEPIANYVPDLAVEVVSAGNTKNEIQRKMRDYFVAGARLAWVVYPKTQTARTYTSPTEFRPVSKSGSLRGGEVLPGFALPLTALFASTRRPR